MSKKYTFRNGVTVTVTPTMCALGDQPWSCVVESDGTPARCFVIEAGDPQSAARDAYRQWLFATNPIAALFGPAI